MRHILIGILCVIWSLIGINAYAHESDIEHVHAADIAAVESSLVLHGVVYSQDSRFRSSAIVNDHILWEGNEYTYNPETGELFPRTVDDEENKLPSLVLIKVSAGEVLLDYSDAERTDPIRIREVLKRPAE